MKFTQTLSDAAILHEFGQRLARYRLNRNLTQQALAREAGVSLRTLNRIESGEPSQTANLIRVLRALGLLDNLEALLPEPALSPMQQLKLQGKTRKRASAEPPAVVAEPWTWKLEGAGE
jgi:transcriptional regulator with XRE-family HTH domain